jgi:hypothetical protein
MYFNKIYNQSNGITTGMSILETEEGYVGYGVSINSISIEQKLVFIKIDHEGEQIFWKQFGNDYQSYFPGTAGGGLIRTSDQNFALSFTYSENGSIFSSLMKLNNNLDTLWKKDYSPVYKTTIYKCIQTEDNGYILTGWVYLSEDDYSDPILLKTDSLGNYQWHQLFGGMLADRGQNVMETPDKGYLIGGYVWNPPVYQSLDALVIKTDSLGNEEWTKTFGNPNVDDDMAHVAMADDGNYLVATVYGEWEFGNDSRIGKQCIYKVNQQGQNIYTYYPGVSRLHNYIKNFRKESGGYIMTGFSYETDTVTTALYTGWMMKLDNNLDSLWYRDYTHFDQLWDDNYLYDIDACADNGFIAIGESHPDNGNNNMWIIKVDSMGCDTAGCATGVFTKEISFINDKEITAYPNPAETEITLAFENTEHHNNMILECYNIYGQKVHSEKIYKGQQQTRLNVSGWSKGIYLAIIRSNQSITGQCRFIIK